MANIAQVYERNQEATLYIGNCDEQVTEELVWELFLQCGPVVSVQMPRDKVTTEHNGYGFVEFKSEDDADYAIKIMHMTKLYGKPIKVNKASQDKRTQEVGANIWVGNLSDDVDEKSLYDTFNTFGLILSTKIARDAETGESKGHGFVSYDSFESADAAIKAMDGQYFSNNTISVHYAFKKDSKGDKHGSAAERLLAANRPIMTRPGFFGNQDNSVRNQRSLILPSSLVTSHNSHMLSTENPVIKADGLNAPSVSTNSISGSGKDGKIKLIKKSTTPSVLKTPIQPPMNSVIPNPRFQGEVKAPKMPPPGMMKIPAGLPSLPGLPPLPNLPNLPNLPPLPNMSNLPPLPNLPNLPPLPGLPGLPPMPMSFPGIPGILPPMMPPPGAMNLGKRAAPAEDAPPVDTDADKKIKDSSN